MSIAATDRVSPRLFLGWELYQDLKKFAPYISAYGSDFPQDYLPTASFKRPHVLPPLTMFVLAAFAPLQVGTFAPEFAFWAVRATHDPARAL